MSVVPVVHEVTFERNTRTGMWRAFCSCGWSHFGTSTEVQARSATHDIEWIPAEPEKVRA